MTAKTKNRGWRLPTAGVVLALMLTACGGGNTSTGDEEDAKGSTVERGLLGTQEPTGSPVDGGTLDFAVYSEIPSLDPAEVQSGSGTVGGTELAALYGVLMRYNSKTGKYEPQLAKSLRPGEDFRTWTLTLRKGVTFSDGTPLDAQAVKSSINRHIRKEGELSSFLSRFLTEIDTPDSETVVFHLSETWPRFPAVLSGPPGNIVSPAGARKWGEDLGRHPVGAGPFVLERFAPGEELILRANQNFWGKKPHLDRLRFVPLKGAQAKLESLEADGIDAAFLRNAEVILTAREQGYPGFMNIMSAGLEVAINNREGHPGANRKVRKAIAHAINPKVLNQRYAEGKGLPGKALFQQFSRWHTDVAATSYDPNKAKQLLAEAKKSGFDGSLRFEYPRINKKFALTVQALLESVGFTIELDASRSAQDHVRKVYVEHDFDLTVTGMNVPDAAPYLQLYQKLVAEGAPMGYRNAKMADLLEKLRAASTQQAKRKVIADIQRQWNKTVPSAVVFSSRQFVAWQDNVHGVIPSSMTVMLFHDAWIEPK